MSPLKDSHLLMVTNTQYKILSVTNTIGYAHLCNMNGEACLQSLLITSCVGSLLASFACTCIIILHMLIYLRPQHFLDFPNKQPVMYTHDTAEYSNVAARPVKGLTSYMTC